MAPFLIGVLSEVVAEAVEAALPARAPLRDPLLGRSQRLRLDLAGAHAADLARLHEPARLQHLDVLDHGRERHVERPRELTDRRGPAREPVDHDPPAGVGEGLENSVKLVKHLLKYYTDTRDPETRVLTCDQTVTYAARMDL